MHAEIRGRSRSWEVWVPDENQIACPVQVFDLEGNLSGTIMAGAVTLGDAPKMVKSYGGPFASQDEAVAYASYLGFTEIRVTKTKTKTEALALARKAKKESA